MSHQPNLVQLSGNVIRACGAVLVVTGGVSWFKSVKPSIVALTILSGLGSLTVGTAIVRIGNRIG